MRIWALMGAHAFSHISLCTRQGTVSKSSFYSFQHPFQVVCQTCTRQANFAAEFFSPFSLGLRDLVGEWEKPRSDGTGAFMTLGLFLPERIPSPTNIPRVLPSGRHWPSVDLKREIRGDYHERRGGAICCCTAHM